MTDVDHRSAGRLMASTALFKNLIFIKCFGSQALHGQAPKCKLINMHELINKFTNDYVTLLPCENGANVNNKG